jgi:flagellar motor protein MotB
VAYADFVTAMMAFFLVMWICGQDQKIRREVSDYFSDPLGAASSNSTIKPNRTGAVTDYLSSGSIPLEDKVATGQGRKSFTQERLSSRATKLVNDWLHEDKDAAIYWRKQAKDQREAARWSREVKEEKKTIEFVATRRLILQFQEEMSRDIPKKADGLYRDLLQQVLQDVNWAELSEDLVGR